MNRREGVRRPCRGRLRGTRTELAAVLDSAEDAITVYSPDGRLLLANAAAEDAFRALTGRVPATGDDARAAIGVSSDAEAGTRMFERARTGEPAVAELTIGDRHLHVRAAPVFGAAGVEAVVMVTRDVTELRRAIAREARLDGALKTARLVAHELNNRLQIVAGYGSLLPSLEPDDAAQALGDVAESAIEAAEVLKRMQTILRFAETTIGGQTVLDLDASTAAAEQVDRHGRAT